MTRSQPPLLAVEGMSKRFGSDTVLHGVDLTIKARIAPVLAGPEGVGLGLDARRVAAAMRPVRIHTGIAHRDGRTGWIGIGVATAPIACFEQALAALDDAP